MGLLTTTPSFLSDPIGAFMYQRKEKLLKKYSTEEKYFRFQWDVISKAQYLKLSGYDSPFMEREETLNALQQRLNQNPEFYIQGIVSEQDNILTLEKLLKANSDRIKIFEEPKQRKKGFIHFGNEGATYWNAKKLTKHPVEKRQGVIRREFSDRFLLVTEVNHNRDVNKIRIVLL